MKHAIVVLSAGLAFVLSGCATTPPEETAAAVEVPDAVEEIAPGRQVSCHRATEIELHV